MQNNNSFYSKYKQLQFIGKGTFGSVYKVISYANNNMYAAKFIHLYGLSQKQIQRVYEQQKIHSLLVHRNIVKFHQSYIQQQQQINNHANNNLHNHNINQMNLNDNRNKNVNVNIKLQNNKILIFVMQYCQYGDLQFYIKRRHLQKIGINNQKEQQIKRLPQQVILNIFIQLLYGIKYLHDHGVIHRDLKPSNIFVSVNGTVKIADFGISKIFQKNKLYNSSLTTSSQQSSSQGSGLVQLTGTPLYSSPQQFENKQKITCKTDIWSLGCVLFQLCTLRHAFDADNVLALSIKINQQKIGDIGTIYSDDLNALVHWMLEKSAQQRPSVNQILQLSFIKKYIKLFVNQFESQNREEKQYQTPKKIRSTRSVNSSQSKSSQNTNDYSPLLAESSRSIYPIIVKQAELNQQQPYNQEVFGQSQQKDEYYTKLKQSCINLLGKQEYNQMYNQIVELMDRIVVVNLKDKKKIMYQLKQVYGSQYFDLAKAVMQLIEIENLKYNNSNKFNLTQKV